MQQQVTRQKQQVSVEQSLGRLVASVQKMETENNKLSHELKRQTQKDNMLQQTNRENEARLSELLSLANRLWKKFSEQEDSMKMATGHIQTNTNLMRAVLRDQRENHKIKAERLENDLESITSQADKDKAELIKAEMTIKETDRKVMKLNESLENLTLESTEHQKKWGEEKENLQKDLLELNAKIEKDCIVMKEQATRLRTEMELDKKKHDQVESDLKKKLEEKTESEAELENQIEQATANSKKTICALETQHDTEVATNKAEIQKLQQSLDEKNGELNIVSEELKSAIATHTESMAKMETVQASHLQAHQVLIIKHQKIQEDLHNQHQADTATIKARYEEIMVGKEKDYQVSIADKDSHCDTLKKGWEERELEYKRQLDLANDKANRAVDQKALDHATLISTLKKEHGLRVETLETDLSDLRKKIDAHNQAIKMYKDKDEKLEADLKQNTEAMEKVQAAHEADIAALHTAHDEIAESLRTKNTELAEVLEKKDREADKFKKEKEKELHELKQFLDKTTYEKGDIIDKKNQAIKKLEKDHSRSISTFKSKIEEMEAKMKEMEIAARDENQQTTRHLNSSTAISESQTDNCLPPTPKSLVKKRAPTTASRPLRPSNTANIPHLTDILPSTPKATSRVSGTPSSRKSSKKKKFTPVAPPKTMAATMGGPRVGARSSAMHRKISGAKRQKTITETSDMDPFAYNPE